MIPGRGTKISQVAQHSQKKKERKKIGSFESKTAILGNEYHVKSEREGEVEDEPRLLACFSQRYYNTFQKELRN